MNATEHQATESLMDSVVKGVQYRDGDYRFFDPGIPLVVLRDLPIVQKKRLIAVNGHDWYDRFDWAKREDPPQPRTLRIPVGASFGKTFSSQEKLLTANEEGVSTRSLASLLVIKALSAPYTRLLSNKYVRCVDKNSKGDRVCVGLFDSHGFLISDYYWDDYQLDILGLASSVRPQRPRFFPA